MFRLRRYRVFLAFAVITVIALYNFRTSSSSWTEKAVHHVAPGKSEDVDSPHIKWEPTPQVALESKKLEIDIPAAKTPRPKQTPPPIKPVSRPVDKLPEIKTSVEVETPAAKPTPNAVPPFHGIPGRPANGSAQTDDAAPSSIPAVHWQKPREKFPVPTESLIRLPTGKPKPLPKIQFDFKKESPSQKQDRESKLDVIRNVAKRSWKGYREHAWLKDELSPVSGNFRDPFAGWGATLVDSLDTLWIMGLKEEFDEAAKAVDKIDFTTTARADIPLFETTIRYLGGLLAAYDVSGKKYKNLLDKAIELAEVLISAFDTPNRMPETYYYWRPSFSENNHRASNRVVLAEIGSLSVEFTRLAQLTGEDKWYDAVARITDNLAEFQDKTRLPGMWPTYLDASGCKRVDWMAELNKPLQKPLPPNDPEVVVDDSENPAAMTPTPTEGEELSPGGKKYIPLDLPAPVVLTPNGINPTWTPPVEEPLVWPGPGGSSGLQKRQLDVEDSEAPLAEATPTPVEAALPTPTTDELDPIETHPVCEEQGFAWSSDYGSEEYTLGGMSDSTYEYLPKEYILLGGLVPKYKTMYEKSVEVVKKHLIFRPMLPNGEDILMSGKLFVPSAENSTKVGDLQPENAHLTCFAGGMFAMGAKLFDRPDDLEIAKKLTEGCIWSYNMTGTGIMPEVFDAVACEDREHCTWNETLYNEVLDPRAEQRLEYYEEAMKAYESNMASASAWYADQLKAVETSAPSPTRPAGADAMDTMSETLARPTPTFDVLDKRRKRQLTDPEEEQDIPEPVVPDPNERPVPKKAPAHVAQHAEEKSSIPKETPTYNMSPSKDSVDGESEEAEVNTPTRVQDPLGEEVPLPSKTLPTFPEVYSPKAPLSHKDYVQNRIQEERLPIGVAKIQSRGYILRPEAIESVWYLYRITGNPYYRQAGWAMFEAVNTATAAEHGNSAIDDVTKTSPTLQDEMESFWMAETLKYFYLLFAEEDVVSLDQWVLNTEAHPLRRPS
ncbi:glycoside hydrolase family 47 protein [Lentithecium fluviatile CBS 122367]|uniref:alpha-1,2-Mannosidase n=1 Tax=Lentithecium fluviatile CBS 122367 TaxID=1168545 RepID=A0A6G1J4X5_9PLEO|nr:glycoside hydrolase family 47 protein [Lentithecium fluviatile CBS 122367]